MTSADLVAIARGLVPPPGATGVAATVEHTAGGVLSNGAPSGLGGRTTYRAAWLVDARRKVPVGPAFERQRDAHRLVDLMSGDPSPRVGADDRSAVLGRLAASASTRGS